MYQDYLLDFHSCTTYRFFFLIPIIAEKWYQFDAIQGGKVFFKDLHLIQKSMMEIHFSNY